MGSQMSGDARARRRGGVGFSVNRSEPSAYDTGDARYRALARMSVSELLTLIADSGWRLNNLFQITNAGWRANLRFVMESRDQTRTYYHEFSDAKTPEEALAGAIWNMEQRRNEATRAAGAKNVDTEWEKSLPPPAPGARNVGLPGASPTHQLDEVIYRDEYKPEILAEMNRLEFDIREFRRHLKDYFR